MNVSFASAYRQLTNSQKMYVDAYVADVEREAARRCERITLALQRAIPEDVHQASRGMLDVPLVRAAINERISEIGEQTELTVHRAIRELMAIAFSNIDDYYSTDENTGIRFIDLSKCTPEQMSAVKSFEGSYTGDGLARPVSAKSKITLHDKLTAMKMLAEYMGMLTADNPYWQREKPQSVNELLTNSSAEHAGDLYSEMING